MNLSKPIYILSAARTPMTALLGAQKDFSANELGALAIKDVLSRAKLAPEKIEEVIMGNVLMAGQGQAPARQAMIKAGMPNTIPATTINKMCGSGMKAAMLAADGILAGHNHLAVAGGMESMTNAPYLLLKGRQGYRLGESALYDHMTLDGLQDAYNKGTLMGVFADACAKKYDFNRQAQDAYALRSLERAKLAIEDGSFEAEITPTPKADGTFITQDEAPSKAKPEKIPFLKPAFNKDGTVTAANSSSISDGAAALILADDEGLTQTSVQPLAKIIGYTSFASEPEWFTTAPVGAIKKLLAQINWRMEEVDLWEINEAFAVVTMAAIQELKLDPAKVNVHGGACALGHPIGASGARILTTLIYALKKYGLKRGVAALCIGGGEATAMAIELV
ncbi:MAG: acetyl-CoA acetyltransferase [Gammaproteobacteria bacterium]|jgi:acetyl-CoA C-acetyltransferase|nr:acetyl-CoA acetyltransferase [Gammaproteobacteria bacterium]